MGGGKLLNNDNTHWGSPGILRVKFGAEEKLSRFRGGTSNTVTEESDTPMDTDEPETEKNIIDSTGQEVPPEYVHEDAPDTDEADMARIEREAEEAQAEAERTKFKEGGFHNISGDPDMEKAIISAAFTLHMMKTNITDYPLAIYKQMRQAGYKKVPYWLCMAYGEAFMDRQNINDMMYHNWRFDKEGKEIQWRHAGVGMQMQ
eukprot:CAMPEP_0197530286 /NCGR_PEP_ID=MMETSP1318-20131121/31352_1 /TAXON_ID=552666 /ORGANISM="Partenskyella glossopodia, Strain RCC365" /LENGTH=202 /DNA_ID=CAMNT_0043086041 /DNA_START=188 /DNA_END=793 /DNA_ORIENTATION=+